MTARTTTAPERLAMVFDTECRPMHYNEWRPESQITAYAWELVVVQGLKVFAAAAPYETQRDLGRLRGGVLLQNEANEEELLDEFLRAYDAVDLLIGHYVRKHDLPLINDHCARLDRKPISERPRKSVHDTKMDFVQVKALGLSQDNLSETFELGADDGPRKHHMAGANWRVANGLNPAGRADAWERVSSDVVQNLQLYAELRRRGVLRPPVAWPTTIRRWPR